MGKRGPQKGTVPTVTPDQKLRRKKKEQDQKFITNDDLYDSEIQFTDSLWDKSCERFISWYVFIEDKDHPDIAVPFDMWEGQQSTLEKFLTDRLIIVLKARQLGLTWLALAYAVWQMLVNPGYTVVAMSKREDDAKELIRRVVFILRYLPEWIIVEKKKAKRTEHGLFWENTTTTVTITRGYLDKTAKAKNKEPSTFSSLTSSPDSGRSLTGSLVFLDEWAFQPWADEIWSAAFPTINRPAGGQVIGLSTAKIGTTFEEIWHGAEAGTNGFTGVFLPWWTDPRRTPQWYELTRASLPHSYLQEYPATPGEAFSAGEATAFPEFSTSIHICDAFTIPAHWRRWMSCDNGYSDPFAWYWFAVNETGTVFVYREYTRLPTEPKIIYSEQAKQVVELSSYVSTEDYKTQVQEPCDFIVAGQDAWATHHRDATGKTLVDYYQEGGLFGFIPAITDRRLRKAVVHEYLKPVEDEITGKLTAKVQIFKTCTQLIDTLPKLPHDEKDNEKVADCVIDHPYDSFGYGLIAYHVGQSQPLNKETPRIRKHKEKLAKKLKKGRNFRSVK